MSNASSSISPVSGFSSILVGQAPKAALTSEFLLQVQLKLKWRLLLPLVLVHLYRSGKYQH
jgi:hypothetical protein